MNKTLVLLSVGRLLQIIILFLASRIMTKFLSHEEVGFLYLLLSVSSYIGLVIMNPVGVFFTRKLYNWSDSKKSVNVLILLCLFTLFASLLTFPAIYIGKFFIGLNGYHWISISTLMSFYIFSSTINNTLIPSMNILNYRISFVVLTFLTQLTALLCSYFLILNEGKAYYWLLGQAISFFVWFIVSFFIFCKNQNETISMGKIKSLLNRNSRVRLLKFASPIAITNISLWLLNQSYRPIIESNIGLEFLGYIGLGFGLASSLSVAFEYLLQQFYLPDFYKNISDNDKSIREKYWNKLYHKMIPLLLFVSFFIAFNSSFIIRILADEKFWDSWVYISFGMVIEFLRMSNNILSLIAQSEMTTRKTIVPYFVGGILSFVMVFLFTSGNYQLNIPLAMIFGNIVVFILLRYKMGKIFTISFPYRNVLIVTLLSIPFTIVPYIKTMYTTYIATIIVLVISSLYFVAIGLVIFNKLEKSVGR